MMTSVIFIYILLISVISVAQGFDQNVVSFDKCDATCQNQALLAKIGFSVIVLFNKRVALAFI